MAQDTATRQAMDRIRDRLVIGANGLLRVNGHVVQVELQYIEHNAMYVATEIFKDLALLGIKVANYKFPEVYCAECGAEIAKLKTSKRKRRG